MVIIMGRQNRVKKIGKMPEYRRFTSEKQDCLKIILSLEEYETIASKNSIHEQYIDYIYGILSWKYGRQEEALRWLEKSIKCTMPDGFQPEGLIGTEEIKLLILFDTF